MPRSFYYHSGNHLDVGGPLAQILGQNIGADACVPANQINASVLTQGVSSQLQAIATTQSTAYQWYERIVSAASTVSTKAIALDFLNKLSKGDRAGARQIVESSLQAEALAISLQALLAMSASSSAALSAAILGLFDSTDAY